MKTGGMRIGSISIFAIIIILCLTVMSLLSFTTARSQQALVDRQQISLDESYANEQAAQQFLADLDMLLANPETNMLNLDAELENVAKYINSGDIQTLDNANENTNTTQVVITRAGNIIKAVFTTNDKTMLTVEVDFSTMDKNYEIITWKNGIIWEEGNEENIWTL